MSVAFSVVIPLYNKQGEISLSLLSVATQTLQPLEVIIVDDGSTDGSLAEVRALDLPFVRVITQQNMGVSVARNVGVEAAKGDYIAFLDADDTWDKDFLSHIHYLIERYPACGMYSCLWRVSTKGKSLPCSSTLSEGAVEDFFRSSLTQNICLPSSVCLSRDVFKAVGGFPEGMKLGEDQFLWLKIASEYPVCFSPRLLMNYNVSAVNRSNSIYRKEQTKFSFSAYFDEAQPWRNEYIARVEIGRAIVFASRGDMVSAREIEKFYGYTKCFKRSLLRLKIINRVPRFMRFSLFKFYDFLARVVAKKYS